MTRTVTVALKASNAQFDQAMGESAKKVKGVEDATKKAAGHSKQSFQDLGRSSMLLGGAMLAGFGLATKAAMDFNAEMSQVKTLSHAGAQDMLKLRDAALNMGQSIGFTANQTADAEIELVKAGISVSDIMGGALKGALQLAAAGQVDVADATETAAIAMTQFKLAGADVPHIADLLAAGADKALGSVGDLSMALKSGGLVAAQFGMSIEDTVGTLAAFAQAGLMGESAGTDLRQMLLKLAAPSVQAADTMAKLGITIYNQQGQFVGITSLAGQLHDKLGKLTQAQRDHAMAVIFGARAIVGANILYQNGAAGVQSWIDTVNDSGFAARQAAGKMDNLKGDLSKLGAAFRKDLIDSGSTANGVLREGTQLATGALKVFGDLPRPLQAAGMGFAGIGGAALLIGGAALVTIPKVAALDKALLDLTNGSLGAKGAMLGLAKAGLAVGMTVGAFEAVSFITDKLAGAAPNVDRLSESLLTFAKNGQTAGLAAQLFGADFGNLAQMVKTADTSQWFSFTGPGTVDIVRARKEIDSLDKALAELVQAGHADVAAKAFGNMKNQMALGGASQKQIEKAFNDYYGALDKVTVSAMSAGAAVDGANGPIRDQAAAAKAASDALTGQADALKALTDPIFAMANAMSGHAKALANYTDVVKKHGKNSREASDALFEVAKATADVTSSADQLAAGVAAGTTSVSDMTAQLGVWVRQGLLTQGQADALSTKVQGLTSKADTLSKTPAIVKVSTTGVPKTLHDLSAVEVAKRQAAQAIRIPIVITGLDGFYKTLTTAHGAAVSTGTGPATGLPKASLPGATPGTAGPAPEPVGGIRGMLGHATGGLITGPGTSTSDSIPSMLSTGEYVLNAKAVQRLGLANLDRLNSRPFQAGPAGGGADPALRSEVARLGQAIQQLANKPNGFRDLVIPASPSASPAEIVGDVIFASRLGRL